MQERPNWGVKVVSPAMLQRRELYRLDSRTRKKLQVRPTLLQRECVRPKSLVNTCSLTIPLLKDSYRLQTDASGTGIGAVLSVVRNDEEFPVAFYSRQLRGAELNYSATELEC